MDGWRSETRRAARKRQNQKERAMPVLARAGYACRGEIGRGRHRTRRSAACGRCQCRRPRCRLHWRRCCWRRRAACVWIEDNMEELRGSHIISRSRRDLMCHQLRHRHPRSACPASPDQIPAHLFGIAWSLIWTRIMSLVLL